MRLKGKLAALLVAFTLLYAMLNWGIHRLVIMPGFLDVEHDQAAKSVKRTVSALNREISGLDGICADWAAWDDAYRFIDDHNPEFISSNLVPQTFSNNHLSLLLFYDLAGNYVAGNTYDLNTSNFFSLPDLPLTTLPQALLRRLTTQPTISGLISTSRGPLLLSAHAIHHSDDSGPTKGFLLMGSFLDTRKIKALGQQTVQDLEITPTAQLTRPQRDILTTLAPANDFLQLIPDQQVMHAYTSFADLEGVPALLIKIDLSRSIFNHGLKTMRLSLALTILSGFIVMCLLLHQTHTKIIKPIDMLLAQITSIRQKGALQAFVVTKGAREIDTVVDEFNTLIAQLVAKEQEQETARQERERLIGELQAALAKVKQLKGLLPICSSCKKIRDDRGYWNQIETYIRDHSEANFTHGICEDCARKLYPELYEDEGKSEIRNLM